MKCTVLFVGYGAGHIRTLIPVVRRLLEAPRGSVQFYPLVLALTTAWQEAQQAGLKPIGFKDLADPVRDADALQKGRELAADLPRNGTVSAEETAAYLGCSYRDLVRLYGHEQAYRKWHRFGRAAFCPVLFAEEAIQKLKVDLLVTTNSPRAEKAFLEASYRAGIPSVVIWPTLATHEIEWIGHKPFASRICVDGEYARDQMIKAGRAVADVITTGNPQYERLLHDVTEEQVSDFRRRMGWASTDRVLLFAQQIEPAIHPFNGRFGDVSLPKRLDDALADALAFAPDAVKLCIRYHPNQQIPSASRKPRVSISAQEDDLEILLRSVDGVFTCSSTLGYLAGLIGLPVFQGMFSVFSADVDLVALAGAQAIRSFEDLPLIYLELAGRSRSSRTHFVNGPRASDQVIDVMRQLMVCEVISESK